MFYDENEIITLEEMCEILHIGKNTAYELLNSQEIQAFRIGRLWKIPRKSVINFINKSLSR